MKIDKELQIKIRGWIEYLSENCIDLSGDNEELLDDDYDKLPKDEGIDVSIVKSPFLVGVMNAKEGL